MTLEELTKLYERKSFLKMLKTGKKPRRSGLLLRLVDLAGSRQYVSSTIISIDPLKNDGFNKCINIYRPQHPFIIDLYSEKFIATLNEHLVVYDIKNLSCYTKIRYKSENVSWPKLDIALLKKYPNKCYEKDGAIFRR
jgi:hypothetical protein